MILMALKDHLTTITKFEQAVRLLGAGQQASDIIGTWATGWLQGD